MNIHSFKLLINQYHGYYSSKFQKQNQLLKNSYINNHITIYSNIFFNLLIQRRRIQFIFIICFIIMIYLFINNFRIVNTSSMNSKKNNLIQIQINNTKLIAYIITENCHSLRFNVTKENIERVFPNFFLIQCVLPTPLNDSRIHSDPAVLMKKFSSNLLAFIELWTYKIPNHNLKTNEFEWTFIFEDDVNFTDPIKIGLKNYIQPLEELMYNNEIRYKHGFFYLGICGPTFDNKTRPIVANRTQKNILLSRKGFGYCLHATGITTNRSRLFWTGNIIISSAYTLCFT